jgi:hypothetical protein
MYNTFSNWFAKPTVHKTFPAWIREGWAAAQSKQHLKTIIAIRDFGYELRGEAKYIRVTR